MAGETKLPSLTTATTMAPKKATPNDSTTTAPTSSGGGGPGLNGKTATESELKFVNAVLSNFIAKPDVDWAAVAAALALKDVKCTKERWRQIKNKFGWKEENNNNGGGGTGGVVGSSPSPAKVTKRTPKRAPRGRKVVTPAGGGASKAGGAAEEGGAVPEKGGGADAGSEVGVGLVDESPTPRQRKKLPNHRPRKEIIKPEPEDTEEEIGHQGKGDAGVV